MPDICMCTGEGCPLKMVCYRYLAKPDELQSYFVVPPYDIKTNTCEHLWKTKEQKK